MSLEDAIIEIEKKDIDLRSIEPKRYVIKEVVKRLCRKGDIKKPGYIVIPETRSILKTKKRAKKFQSHLLEGVNAYLQRYKPELLKRNSTSILPKNKRRKFYNRSKLTSESPSYIEGQDRGDLFFHFDYPNQLYCSLLYGDDRNVHGGTFKIFDALKLAKEKNYALKHIVHFVPLKILEPDEGWYHHQTQGFVEQLHAFRNDECITDVKVDNNKYPLIIFSNRYEDGILHGASRTTRKDINKGPAVRPIWALGISYNLE